VIPDCHCHLDQIEEPGRAVAEAAAAGVGPILAVSMDAASAEKTLALRDQLHGQVLAGVGLHPSRIPELSDDEAERELRRLEALLPEADFVGEIGLDYKDAVTERDRARQGEALARQLGWAEASRLAVNLHSRRADREVLSAAAGFRARSGLGALMHWFTHSRKLARVCADGGIFISPGPSILGDLRTAEVAAAIDPVCLLLETDSPVVYGELGSARPEFAVRVFARLAELHNTNPETLAERIRSNLDRYLSGA
jgi:TatD DNase family protein